MFALVSEINLIQNATQFYYPHEIAYQWQDLINNSNAAVWNSIQLLQKLW